MTTDGALAGESDTDYPPEEDWPLKRLLTEVVGSGPKSADDMTYGQARVAFERVLDRSADPTTLGAFLLANRWKRNGPTEIAGFRDAMCERSVTVAAPSADPVDCGANYDGKTESALLGVAAGVVAAAAGTPVVAHSGGRLPASHGATYRHVLDELGVETDLSPGESADLVDDVGFGFYAQHRFNPGVDALADRREALGVRSFLNTVETLANPADADVHLGSFFHRSFGEKLVNTLGESRADDVSRVVLVQGLEGYDDVRPGATRYVEWDASERGGEIASDVVETADYGLDADREALAVADVAGDSAAITEAVLTGDRTDEFRDAVVLNAAIRLWAGRDVGGLAEGVARAEAAIAEGSAAAVLADLRSHA